MRNGLTTGTCAALAAKAAAMLLISGNKPSRAEVPLPDGSRVSYAVSQLRFMQGGASAAVMKDAGDDPDITHEAWVEATVCLNGTKKTRFFAGPGVGTITRPGLALPPGEAAINPGPREQIIAALNEVCQTGYDVTVSVPGGEELAQKTFNPRLGIVGGISILGTSGRVRPFSVPALQAALKCALDVAIANGEDELVLVPGHMGNRAAQQHFKVRAEQIVDVSNEWGYMLGLVAPLKLNKLMVLGHPGKLAKIPQGHWQTHSSQSPSPLPWLHQLCQKLNISTKTEQNTVEELFMISLSGKERLCLAQKVAGEIAHKIQEKFPGTPEVTVVLINLAGDILGTSVCTADEHRFEMHEAS